MAAFAVTMDSPAGPVLYLVAGAYGTLLSCVGARRMPPPEGGSGGRSPSGRRSSSSATCSGRSSSTSCTSRHPSAADVFYLLSYPATALGLMWLIRGRRSGRDRAAFLDAAILTTCCTVVVTVFVIGPAAAAGGTSILDQAVAGAYPAADLLILAVVIRMLTTGTVRNLSLWALVTGLTVMLFADLYYVVSVISDAPYPGWIDNGYLLSYLLLGFAALHPSAHTLSEPAPDRPEKITLARLAFLGAALVLIPVVDQLAQTLDADRLRSSWVLLVGGVLSALFVVVRCGTSSRRFNGRLSSWPPWRDETA